MDNRLAQELSDVLEKAKGKGELCILLEGLLTPRELHEICTRWHLMQLLLEGRTQRDIAAELGISLGTIARGSRLLQYGSAEFRNLIEKIASEVGDDH